METVLPLGVTPTCPQCNEHESSQRSGLNAKRIPAHILRTSPSLGPGRGILAEARDDLKQDQGACFEGLTFLFDLRELPQGLPVVFQWAHSPKKESMKLCGYERPCRASVRGSTVKMRRSKIASVDATETSEMLGNAIRCWTGCPHESVVNSELPSQGWYSWSSWTDIPSRPIWRPMPNHSFFDLHKPYNY